MKRLLKLYTWTYCSLLLSYHGKCLPADKKWNFSAFRYIACYKAVLKRRNFQGTYCESLRNEEKRTAISIELCKMLDVECPWKIRIIALFLHGFYTLTVTICCNSEAILHLYLVIFYIILHSPHKICSDFVWPWTKILLLTLWRKLRLKSLTS